MAKPLHVRLYAYVKQFESVDMVIARHDRRIKRTIWTLIITGGLWLLAEFVIHAGRPQGSKPLASTLPWIERYLWDSTPLFEGLLYVGWVHSFQALMCLWMVISLAKTAYAQLTLPGIIERTKQARDKMSPRQLRELYEGAVRLNLHTDEEFEEAQEATQWMTKATRNAGIVCVGVCLLILLTMPDLTQNITRVSRWDSLIQRGPLGPVGVMGFVLGVAGAGLCFPMHILLKLSEAQTKRFNAVARQEMIVLQRDVMGERTQGGLSRAEATQGGELSVEQGGELSVEE